MTLAVSTSTPVVALQSRDASECEPVGKFPTYSDYLHLGLVNRTIIRLNVCLACRFQTGMVKKVTLISCY